jgi:mRNA-degrading endonuclease YafQ of YafQ-DinJ toxin-antitoxin module
LEQSQAEAVIDERRLRYAPGFVASFRELSPAGKIAVVHAIESFRENPFDASLNNHALMGIMAGKRVFSADHDLRIVFVERGNYQDVTLLHVGGHAIVYRR